MDKPTEKVRKVAEKAVEKVAELLDKPLPGAPASEPPQLEEPTEPRGPLPRKADQATPATRSPSGADLAAPPDAMGQRRPGSPPPRAPGCATATTR